jgi:spore coat polysaccharide biosynthesis protein SpsF
MTTVAIVQARMSSTRLPGKVLRDLAGEPMLARVVDRLRRARSLNRVVVATTTEPDDQPIVEFCLARSIDVFRGSLPDVLDRYYRCAKQFEADVVVRITSDCPVIDPEEVDRVVETYRSFHGTMDYVTNSNPIRTLPRGLDVEVFSFATLERAWRDDTDPAWREHVTPYLYRSQAGFRQHCATIDTDESHNRWTVDTPEDYALIRAIYEHFGHDRMSWREILSAVADHPEWAAFNCHIEQKTF